MVCLRIHIGAMRPSGYNGELGVRGDRGECRGWNCWSSAGGIFRGGNLTSWTPNDQQLYEPKLLNRDIQSLQVQLGRSSLYPAAISLLSAGSIEPLGRGA